ncbi:MAG TPA: cytochrome c oxidase assembly protein [Gemmatimonadaceae bacterium]
MSEFTVHWSTVIGIVGLAALFEYQRRRVTDDGGRANDVATGIARHASPVPRPFVFHGALLIMFLALNGPLHDLSDSYLFSAHMIQHLVLAFVVAPMLLMGVTGDMLRPLISKPVVRRVAEWGLSPTRCFTIFNVVIAGWHLPPMYNYALAHHPVHILQHLMILAASVIMWWPVLSPLPELPRLSYPGQMLYLFLMSIPMAIVSVYIAYADGVLYPMYASAPRFWGISPMSDQMIGGLIMWIPGGLFFYTVISVVFLRWNQRGAEDSQAGAQVDWRTAS